MGLLGAQPAPGLRNKPMGFHRTDKPDLPQRLWKQRDKWVPLSSPASPPPSLSLPHLRLAPLASRLKGQAWARLGQMGVRLGLQGGQSACSPTPMGTTRQQEQFLSLMPSPKASGPSPCLWEGNVKDSGS